MQRVTRKWVPISLIPAERMARAEGSRNNPRLISEILARSRMVSAESAAGAAELAARSEDDACGTVEPSGHQFAS